MQALSIGHTHIDVAFLTDRLPIGDEKHVASAYAISFGENAAAAAFCCAKLSIVPDLLTRWRMTGLGACSGDGGEIRHHGLSPKRKRVVEIEPYLARLGETLAISMIGDSRPISLKVVGEGGHATSRQLRVLA
jgi:hypothetical protein